MPTVYDQDADKQHDMEHLRAAEQSAEQAPYDREFNDIAANFGDTAEHPLGTQEAAAPLTAGNTGGSADKSPKDAADLKEDENKAADDTVGNGYKPRNKITNIAKKWSGKKKGIFASILGTGILGGGILLGTIATGPAQILQLAAILNHSFSKQKSDTTQSENHWLRDARALAERDIRYTDVGLVGGSFAKGLNAELAREGISYSSNSDFRGNPTSIEYDLEKLAENNPKLKGLSPEERVNFLNNEYGSSANDGIKLNPDGKTASLDMRGFRSQDIAGTLKTSRKLIDDTGLISWGKARALKKFWGLGSLFHPFSKAIENKIADKAAARAKSNNKEKNTPNTADEAAAMNDSTQGIADTSKPDGVRAFDNIKSENDSVIKNANKALGFIGPAWITGCMLKQSGVEIVKVNRDLVVLPAAEEAVHLIAMAGQIEAGGSDITPGQVGGTIANFTDNAGKTIWDSGEIALLEGSSNATATTTGQLVNALPGEERAAFKDDKLALNLTNAGNTIVDAMGIGLTKYVGLDPCGLVVGIGVAAVSTAIQAMGIASDAADGGASSAAIWGATKLLEDGVISYAFGDLLGYVTDNFAKAVAAPTLESTFKTVGPLFSGPLGGSFIAYGSREAANMISSSSGGVSLGNNTSTIVGYAGQQDAQQFRKENIATRLFNIDDPRTLAGHLSTYISPNFFTNISNMFSGAFNVFGSLTSIFKNIGVGLSSADTASKTYTGNYDWGFPQYGIPDSLMNNPEYNDPFQNSQALGLWLTQNCNNDPSKGNCGSGGQYGGYTQREANCFARELTYSNNVWDVLPIANTDINPNSLEYTKAHCDDLSDPIWDRLIMFTNDTATMKTMDCIANSDATAAQSCADEDISGTDTTTSGTGTTTPSGVTGDAKTLAQKLLDEKNTGKVDMTASTESDLQKTVQGQQVYIGDSAQGGGKCSNPVPASINATLLQVLLNISAQYKIMIQNIVSGHPCDTLKHSTGHASDIFMINGSSLNDAWWAGPNAISITNNIGKIEHDTDPSNTFGLGVGCSAYGKVSVPTNIVVFSDSGNFNNWNSGCSGTPSGQDEIHVDVRGGS